MGHVIAPAAPLTPLALGIIPGIREIVLVTLVALALYGRPGSRLLMRTRYGRLLSPVLDRVRASPAAAGVRARPRRRGRWYWAFALTFAAALAAWVATRAVVKNSPPVPRAGAGDAAKP